MKAFLKSLYNRIPCKRGAYSLLKQVWIPPESLFKHLHFKGVFRVPVDEDHSFLVMHHGFAIENEIFWLGLQGGWEKVSMNLWIELCRKSGCIFDIGSNTGIYSLVANSVNPGSKVYAFEPVNRVFKKLESNIALNHYKTRCLEYAASDYDGKAVIYDNMGEHILSVAVNKDLSEPDKTVHEVEISTIRLDTFIKNEQIDGVDLMKIDVETHEFEVLKGMGDFLGKYRPTMLIEILEDDIGRNVESLVKDLGYLYFNIDENKGIRRVDAITKSDYFNYLLCNEQVANQLGLL